MSFITSGMHNFRTVDNFIPSNKFAVGGSLGHDATCVASKVALLCPHSLWRNEQNALLRDVEEQ